MKPALRSVVPFVDQAEHTRQGELKPNRVLAPGLLWRKGGRVDGGECRDVGGGGRMNCHG